MALTLLLSTPTKPLVSRKVKMDTTYMLELTPSLRRLQRLPNKFTFPSSKRLEITCSLTAMVNSMKRVVSSRLLMTSLKTWNTSMVTTKCKSTLVISELMANKYGTLEKSQSGSSKELIKVITKESYPSIYLNQTKLTPSGLMKPQETLS
jgi:hypothetical protein